MRSDNHQSKPNQTAKFAKIVILLTPFAMAVAGATLYQKSKPSLPTATLSASETYSERDTEVIQPLMLGEPFTPADGVNSISPDAAPSTKARPEKAALTHVQNRAQAYAAAERQFMRQRFGDSAVTQHAAK